MFIQPVRLAVQVSSPYFWILVLLALIVAAALWRNARRANGSRAEQLMDTYRVLDEAALSALPDEQVVDAVAANLLAKLDERKPDPVRTLPLLSQGRCAVYGIWTLTNTLKEQSLAAYLRSPAGRFAELTADGLELVGATVCAAALRAAWENEDADAAAVEASLRAAVADEQPLTLCVKYIRDNTAEFVDG